MRRLLDSSWMKFGPAGRDEWVSGSHSPPPADQQPQGHTWNEISSKHELIWYVLLPLASFCVFGLVLLLLWRRFRRQKVGLSSIITLDLQHPERNAEVLSSRLDSTSSDMSDGVFLMVYLPPPYEQTLEKITRAASLSSGKDVESIRAEDLEARLCPELRSSAAYV